MDDVPHTAHDWSVIVRIHHVQGQLTLTLHPNASVATLKELILRQYEIRRQRNPNDDASGASSSRRLACRLVCRGREITSEAIEAETSIAQAGVRDGDVLHAMIRELPPEEAPSAVSQQTAEWVRRVRQLIEARSQGQPVAAAPSVEARGTVDSPQVSSEAVSGSAALGARRGAANDDNISTLERLLAVGWGNGLVSTWGGSLVAFVLALLAGPPAILLLLVPRCSVGAPCSLSGPTPLPFARWRAGVVAGFIVNVFCAMILPSTVLLPFRS